LSLCETHRFAADRKMGFAVLDPSYGCGAIAGHFVDIGVWR
jgi:hypothetical protein